MSKKIAFVAKPHHPLAAELLTSLRVFCEEHHLAYVIEDETYARYNEVFEGNGPHETAARASIWKDVNLIIVLGGDGTLISTCRHIRNSNVQVMGVNLGTLGFLTELLPEQMIPCLEAYVQGKTQKDKRPLLEIEVTENGGSYTLFAVNDVVVNKQALARIFALNLSVNNEEASLLRGDGLIISTPSGSTAYSLAAGGSIVHPSVDALLVTPICPHSLSARPFILDGNDSIRITLGHGYESDSVFLTVDGQEGRPLQQDTSITVTKSAHQVSFVRLEAHGYFSNLKTKLRWGA